MLVVTYKLNYVSNLEIRNNDQFSYKPKQGNKKKEMMSYITDLTSVNGFLKLEPILSNLPNFFFNHIDNEFAVFFSLILDLV